jgi:hypothetical protein
MRFRLREVGDASLILVFPNCLAQRAGKLSHFLQHYAKTLADPFLYAAFALGCEERVGYQTHPLRAWPYRPAAMISAASSGLKTLLPTFIQRERDSGFAFCLFGRVGQRGLARSLAGCAASGPVAG